VALNNRGMSAEAPRVTVAVPVKDRRQRMLHCLDSLIRLEGPSYEVLVLDNESTDGTAEACRERARGAPVPVRVAVLSGSVGRVRNQAAELSRAEVIAYTDSDCMADPGWLRAGLERLEREPDLGILQGRTLPEPGVELGRWHATIEVTGYTKRFESCNLFVRRDALLGAEGFDEQIGHFWEDTAAGWSLLRAGWRAGYEPAALVYHDVTHPGLRWWMRRGLRYGNVAAVVRRYPELRDELLFGGYFLDRRTAAAALGVVGLALAPRRRPALALTLPWALLRPPPRLSPRGFAAFAETGLFDLSVLAGTVTGSIRHRTFVL
jgi:mycofactocin glycosyltransferase